MRYYHVVLYLCCSMNKSSPSLALEENPDLRFLPKRTFCKIRALCRCVRLRSYGMLVIVVDSVDGGQSSFSVIASIHASASAIYWRLNFAFCGRLEFLREPSWSQSWKLHRTIFLLTSHMLQQATTRTRRLIKLGRFGVLLEAITDQRMNHYCDPFLCSVVLPSFSLWSSQDETSKAEILGLRHVDEDPYDFITIPPVDDLDRVRSDSDPSARFGRTVTTAVRWGLFFLSFFLSLCACIQACT